MIKCNENAIINFISLMDTVSTDDILNKDGNIIEISHGKKKSN
jgi:hypothetical protein